MSDAQKSALGISVAGKTQYEVFAATINGFNQVLNANETAMESSGSATRENEKYMQGLEAKISLLKKTWDDLINNTIKSDYVSSLLSMGTATLQFINDTGGLPTLLTTLAGTFLALNGAMTTNAIASVLSVMGSGFMSLVKIIPNAITAFNQWSLSVISGTELMQAAVPVVGLLLVAVSGITIAYKKYKQHVDEVNLANEELLTTESELDNIMGSHSSTVDVETRSYAELKKERQDAIHTANEEAKTSLANVAYANELVKVLDTLKQKENLTNLERERSKQIVSQLNNLIPDLNLSIDNTTGKLAQETSAVYRQIDAYKALIMVKAAEAVAAGAAQRKIEAQLNIEKAYDKSAATIGELPMDVDKQTYMWYRNDAINAAVKDIKNNQKIVSEADKEIQRAFELANKYNKDYADLIKTPVGGVFDEDKDSGTSYSGGGSTAKQTIDVIKEQSDLFEEQIKILEHRLFLMQQIEGTETAQIEFEKQIQKVLNSQANWFREQGLSDNSEYIRNLQQQWWGYSDKIKEIQEKIHQKIVDDAKKSIDKLKELYSKEQSDLEATISYISKRSQDEIDVLEDQKKAVEDAYNAQIESLQKANDKLEDQITLEQKLKALAEAKSKRQLVYKNGQFEYMQDIDAVSQAQSDLTAYQREQKLKQDIANIENLRDNEIKSIEDQIKYWQAYKDEWDNVVNDYTDNQNRLIAEQILGTNLEAANWETRIANAQSFADRYAEIMNQLSSLDKTGQKIGDGDDMTDEQIKAQMEANSAAWHTAKTQAERDALHSANVALNNALTNQQKYNPSVGQWYSNQTQTKSTPILNNVNTNVGTANLAKNVMEFGKLIPTTLLNTFKNITKETGTNISVGNVTLPSVSNAQSFVTELKNLAFQKAYQRA